MLLSAGGCALERLHEALGLLQLFSFTGLALAAVYLWRRGGGRSAACLAGAFGVLALAAVAGRLLPVRSDDPVVLGARKLLVVLILLFPYLLHQFTSSLSLSNRWLLQAARWLTGAVVAATLLLPRFPEPGDPRPPVFYVYLALILVLWVFLSAAVARALWRAGMDQPTVVRRRMRTMALGALALAAAVATSGLAPSEGDIGVTEVVVQLLALGSGPLFLLGFATPRLLRAVWRREDESMLREAEIDLMRVGTAADIAEVLLPAAARLVGGRAAVLVDTEGRIVGAHGMGTEEAEEVASRQAGTVDGEAHAGSEPTLAIRLQSGTLVVERTAFSPFFGTDELELLGRVGALVDVALERARADWQIHELNQELHGQVRELEAANKDLARAQAEAQQANEAKSEFLSRMSHELRTPLNAILGFGQLLDMDLGAPRARDSVGQILKAGKHLLGLINEVLDLAGIESGKLTMSMEEVAVGEVVVEVLDLMAPMAATSGVTLEGIPSSHAHCTVLADRQRLKQVLLNLVSNAVKYNRPGGTVRLSASYAEAILRLDVIDTGPGISPENLERLFAPFQCIGAEQTEIEGSGLGLALSKRLVEVMGGTMGVESRLGEGTTFWFTLTPVEARRISLDGAEERQSVRLDEGEPSASPAGAEGKAGGIKLLYIEDNNSNLKLIEELFHRRPEVELLTAMQGGLALDIARHHRPHLILLDLHLPDMHGADVLHALRSDPSTQAIPVVILSADATPGQMQRLLDAGANSYLTKPIDLQRVLELVDAMVTPQSSR